jgi:hypothetical protein
MLSVTSMGTWKNEDDIKAELRTLTDELRQLREELRSMVAPPKPNPTRAFLHRQMWPPPEAHDKARAPAPRAPAPRAPAPRATAADRERRRKRKP